VAEKNMKAFREMTPEELGREEQDLRKELFNLRFQQVLGQVENPLRIREVRRTIAKVKTAVREKVAG
jgi:large subunit ribosomal protein L29